MLYRIKNVIPECGAQIKRKRDNRLHFKYTVWCTQVVDPMFIHTFVHNLSYSFYNCFSLGFWSTVFSIILVYEFSYSFDQRFWLTILSTILVYEFVYEFNLRFVYGFDLRFVYNFDLQFCLRFWFTILSTILDHNFFRYKYDWKAPTKNCKQKLAAKL